MHGHIKPANVMAVGDLIKISSDGLCGAGESSRVLGATSIYAAPEIADGGGMSPASDVWSLGMTLVEALTQSPPVWKGTEQANWCCQKLCQSRFSILRVIVCDGTRSVDGRLLKSRERLKQAPLAPQETGDCSAQKRVYQSGVT